MSLLDVQFQSHAQRQLQRALTNSRVPHAYLFQGPDGVGKELLARGFAQLLLCSDPQEREAQKSIAEKPGLDRVRLGCGNCEECRAVAAGTHPDFHLIHRRLNREHPDPVVRKRTGLELSVDVIRHFVIDAVALTPMRGRAKVFVIREADRITPQAQNALLKTLEEPPGQTFIILLSSSLDRLLPTTQSRCQLVRFDRLPTTFIAEEVQRRHSVLTRAEAAWYAQSGEGSLGRALENIDGEFISLNQRIVTALPRLSPLTSTTYSKSWQDEAKKLADFFSNVDPDISDTEATRRALKTIFQLTAGWYGDVVRLKCGAQDALLNLNHHQELALFAERLSFQAAIDSVKRLVEAERQLDLNANVQLCVDCLINDLAHAPSEAAFRKVSV